MGRKPIITKKGLIILSILVAVCVVPIIFAKQIFGENSVFYAFESSNTIIQEFVRKIPAIIRSIMTIVFFVAIYKLLNIVSHVCCKNNNRALTICSLFASLIKWVIAVIVFLLILSAFGADTPTLLASAGILTLVIGLGAQSLISDIIAGFFLVFEGEYQVGDIITIDGWRGTVIDIGIRVTRLIDAGGNIKTVNNSDVRNVINQTNELSVAKVYMSIDYGESLEKAELILKDNLNNVAKKIPSIVEGPFYKGVSELSASSIDLMFIAKCKESDIYQVQRDLTRELYLVLVKNDIEIPFNQLTVSYRGEPTRTFNKKDEKEAKKFIEEQKLLTKDIDEQENN